ncbi:hypothetical protein ACEU0C_002863, partial [Stenotrophomonas indicatrix]|uniref:hypothetical protein n=1 Tax=Stenotrophomonas indicatrix TaxID=2045451 RepID=UPI00372DDD17
YVHVSSVAASMRLTPPQPDPPRLRQLSANCRNDSWGQIRFPQENGSDPIPVFRYLKDVSTKVDTYQQQQETVEGGALWVCGV